jgi:peroxiredoxin
MLSTLALVAGLALAQSVSGPGVLPGDPALLFSLPALNEDAAMRAVSRRDIALADFTGVLAGFPAKAVVLEFVRKQGGEGPLAALERVHRKYGARGVRVVAIVVDEGELAALSDWVGTQKLSFPVLRDAYRIVVERYGVRSFPTMFVIDGEGRVDSVGMPKESTVEAELDRLLEPYLR